MGRLILLCLSAPLVMLIGIGCGTSKAETKTRVLSSGTKIEVLSTYRAERQGRETLYLHYVTAADLRDRSAIGREIKEIWADFRGDAEAADVEAAVIIAATGAGDDFVTQSRSFAYEKADGEWKALW